MNTKIVRSEIKSYVTINRLVLIGYSCKIVW